MTISRLLMNCRKKLLVALLPTVILPVSAGEIEYQECYAKWSTDSLTVGNTLMERTWSIKDGLLTPVSFKDKVADREWLRAPGRQPAPHPGGDLVKEDRTMSFTTNTGKRNTVEKDSLILDISSKGSTTEFQYRLQVFPDASGVTINFEPDASAKPTAQSDSDEKTDAPDGLESTGQPKKKSRNVDAIDDLLLSVRNFRFHQTILADQTDHNNELVHEKEWMPLKDHIEAAGNLFSIDDPLTGDGLVFLKLAPLPHARPVKNQWDARVMGGGQRVTFAGHGYRSVLLSYTGGDAGRIAALQDYQRCIRQFDAQRDARFLSNTWGDRSKDARVSEDFLRKEIDAGAKLGVDVVQVDDGWQKGMSGNSAAGKGGAWGDFYSADPDFWTPHPERFPNGLKPLVDAAAAKGMKFGLWFGPHSKNDMEFWQKDADLLLGCCEKEGIEYIKIDSVQMVSTLAEKRLEQFYDKVLTGSDGRVVFDSDVTAGLRTGYFGTPHAGPIFVENRYTDWGIYWPHLTLRNLWELSRHVDPLRLRMEFLNNQRNTKNYGDHPLAPAQYDPDTLFATVMFSNPLGWFEVSQLPESYFEKIPPLVAAWKKEREAIFSGHIIPIGSAPDGASWTGFSSVSKDRSSARIVVFREMNESDDWSVNIPLLDTKDQQVTILGGSGTAKLDGDTLNVRIPDKLQYLFMKVE